MERADCIAIIALILILQFSKTVQTLEYIYPQPRQNIQSIYPNIVPITAKSTSQQLPLNSNYQQNFQQEGQLPVKRQEMIGGHGGHEGTMSHQGGHGGHEGTMSHDGGMAHYGYSEISYHHEPQEHHHSLMKDLKKMNFEAALKIVLAILPFVITLTFVPLLVITIGVLLIPIVRLKFYAEHGGERSEGRDNKEEISQRIISSIGENKKYY